MSKLDADKPRHISKLGRAALDIVMLAQRRGQENMTLQEILHAVRKQAGHQAAEKSSLSRELTAFSREGVLLIRPVKRKSAWEALPPGADQQSWPASAAYYAPGVRAAAPVAAVPAASADFY